ncbi:MAG TPA: sugar phosphate isomerase/epimerase [Lacunisphaera sp.]|jgi:sugar phosphate isomerase/epimerase|nr:sugar phosphate isomerase/epimerase [Lacunisphaera sp.]
MRSNLTPGAGFSRRQFLAASGVIPAALLAQSLPVAALAAEAAAPKPSSRRPIGLELYSVRDALAKDLPGTLRQVAAIGYEVVEFYAPYFDWSMPYAKEVRRQLDDLGLRCLSTHNHIEALTPGAGLGKAIELGQILGTRYVVMASSPREIQTADDWKRLAGQLATATEQLKPHGLSAGYHNHQAEWKTLEGGQRILEILADNTPPEFLLQLDVGTCMEAGQDPVAWIKAHPGRIRCIHLKDWAPGRREDEKGYRVLFGEGVSPWADIVAAAESVGGIEFYLLEQEGSRFGEFETARRCLASWKKFRGQA